MKVKPTLATAFVTLLALPFARAQGTAFTYQGRLNVLTAPANGTYDFSFALFGSNATNTGQVGSTLTNLGVGVTNGLFTTTLDFGYNFTGADRWLSIAVRTNAGGAFTQLSPLLEVTPAPYAMFAPTSGLALTAASANSVAAGNIAGTLATGQLPPNVVLNGQSGVTLSGSFSGNGSGLSGVVASDVVNGGAGLTNVTSVSNAPAWRFSTIQSCRLPNNHNAAFQTLGSRIGWIANCSITNLRLAFANFYCPGEIGLGSDALVRVAIEYPSNTITRVTWDGSSNGIITNGTILWSDNVVPSVKIPDGALFWTRSWFSNSAGIYYCNPGSIDTNYMWEITSQYGGPGWEVPDKTGGTGPIGGPPTGDNASFLGPCAIIAQNPNPAVLVLGDSRDTGQDDYVTDPQMGIDRVVGRFYGVCNLSVNGDSLPGNGDTWTQRISMARYADYVLTDLGVNGFNYPNTEAYMTAFIAMIPRPVYIETLSPRTTSSDNWTTVSGQSMTDHALPGFGTDDYRKYNDDIRNHRFAGPAGFVDVAAANESSIGSGLWAANGTSNFLTSGGAFGGLHGPYYRRLATIIGDFRKSNPSIPIDGFLNGPQTNGGSLYFTETNGVIGNGAGLTNVSAAHITGSWTNDITVNGASITNTAYQLTLHGQGRPALSLAGTNSDTVITSGGSITLRPHASDLHGHITITNGITTGGNTAGSLIFNITPAAPFSPGVGMFVAQTTLGFGETGGGGRNFAVQWAVSNNVSASGLVTNFTVYLPVTGTALAASTAYGLDYFVIGF